MAYNLPKPWSPGYALPDYVRVEGLQRRAFTTMQMPRGTYDGAKVGTAGYAVPGYVRDEGTGQGAVVTKWMPRGTVPGNPRWLQTPNATLVAATRAQGGGSQYEIAAGHGMSSDTHPLTQYGTRVANHLMTSIRTLPPAARKPALKQLLTKIDPTLWTRVNATATKASAAGVPAPRALHHAIATEFHSGFVRELRDVGTTGKIKTRSQVGLGCFGCAAIGLGDTAPATPPPANPPGPYWSRARPGQDNQCGYYWNGGDPWPTLASCPTPRVHVADDAGNPGASQGVDLSKLPVNQLPYCGSKDRAGVDIKPCNPNVPAGFGKLIDVGPFRFQGDATSQTVVFNKVEDLPAAVKAYLFQQIDAKKHVGHYPETPDGTANPLTYWFGISSTYDIDHEMYENRGLDLGPPSQALVVYGPHPYNKQQYGLFLWMRGQDLVDGKVKPDGYPPFLQIRWMPLDKASSPGGVWNAITSAVNTVGDWVQGAADTVGTIACQSVNQPGAAQAASADPRAAAGVLVAQGVCASQGMGPKTPAQPVAPVVKPPATVAGAGMSGTEKLLLLGGALGAVLLLTRKNG